MSGGVKVGGLDESVAVIMPAYNAEQTIAQSIESVLAQTYRRWRLYVIDDGSMDGTASVARGFAARDERVRVIVNRENRGVASCRNRAVGQVVEPLVAFLDSDDLWEPNKLERQVSFMRVEQECDLCFTGSAFMDASGARRNYVLHAPKSIGFEDLLKQNLISCSSVLVRSDVMRCYPMFVTTKPVHEDYVSWLRMLSDGHLACGIDEPLLVYRLSAGSKSSSKGRAALMNWNAYSFAGIGFFKRMVSMVHYAVRGLRKYRRIKRGGRR